MSGVRHEEIIEPPLKKPEKFKHFLSWLAGKLREKKKKGSYLRVFWINIAKSEVNLRYRNCSNLFGISRREIKFRYYCYRNSTKSMREKKKKVERENIELWQRGYRISCAQFCYPGVRGVPEVKQKKKKIDKLIVAMPLPK